LNKLRLILLIFLSSCVERKENINTKEIIDWQFNYKNKWHKAKVPGNNFTDLLNHKFIEDPFYKSNEKKITWVIENDWTYRSTFTVKNTSLIKRNQILSFFGLDTYAEIYLNDSLILETNNMFKTWDVDVSELLKKENVLIAKFNSNIKIEKQKEKKLGYILPGGQRVFSRKAGFHYGWDWGPKITPSGIWRKVMLTSWDACRIRDIYIVQNDLTDSLARITANIEIESQDEKEVKIKTYNNSSKDIKLKPGINKISININILNPEFWWPNGYGNQKLYHIPISICDENTVIDSQTKKIGLREIQLVTKDSTNNHEFYFMINGKPMFMKGANYIPQDNLQNRITDTHYHDILKDVVDANMNMLRVWGGGIYEENIFYDLCDSLGILVWQDFMFACAMYPSDSLFIQNVKEEAIQNVKRLRNHACIALWCGNNENSEGWHRWGWQDSFTKEQKNQIWEGYKKLFKETLPEIVELNSQSDYWESSPKYGRGNPKHQYEGDAHYWGVWHDAEPFEIFEEKVPRFMSEFGFQSFPQISTIATFSDTSEWSLDSESMKNHQKHPRGNSLIIEYMQREYHMPNDFNKFIYTTQLLQAEGMRIGLEVHRRSRPYCMGSLYWQLNDCWPGISWSSRDYNGNWKALHYVVKKVFNPIVLSIYKNDKNKINVYGISDLNKDLNDSLIIKIGNMNGDIKTTKKKINIIANSSTKLIEDIGPLKDDEFIICSLQKKKIHSKTIFEKPVKDITFLNPEITISNDKNSITLNSKYPAFQVYLHGINENLSDNFFALLPGENKIINLKNADAKRNNLLIWSLYDLNKK